MLPASLSLSQDRLPQLQDADEFDDAGDLGAALTPTSNATPSASHSRSRSRSRSRSLSAGRASPPASDADEDPLPPLLISPAELESLQAQLREKTALLSVATDHISEQSVQIQSLTAQLQAQSQSQASLLSLANSDELRQFQTLVQHLHQMIAQRDEIIGEQEKELNYYQQQLRSWKSERAREVDDRRALEAELDRHGGHGHGAQAAAAAQADATVSQSALAASRSFTDAANASNQEHR